MKIKVTEQGVLVPKQLLEDIDEVEIHKEKNLIIITPVSTNDPILELGKQPVISDVDDASVNHDHYLYNQ